MKAKRKRICGIYAIQCLVGGRIYIGQSNNIYRRFVKHKQDLRESAHFNIVLQRFYNKFGENSFKFSIISIVPEIELDFWETFFIRAFDSIRNGFNFNEGGRHGMKRFREFNIQGPDGKIYHFKSIRYFAEKYDLNQHSVSRVLNGHLNHTGGWHLPNTPPPTKPVYLKYKLKSPEGIIYEGENLRELGRRFNINNSGLFQVLKGVYKQYKGWTLVK